VRHPNTTTMTYNPNADPDAMYRPAVTPEEWTKREAVRHFPFNAGQSWMRVRRRDDGLIGVQEDGELDAAIVPELHRALVAFLVAGAAWWPSDRHLDALEKVAGGFEPTADETRLLEELTVMLQSLTRGA
jgi:hypothetical protein